MPWSPDHIGRQVEPMVDPIWFRSARIILSKTHSFFLLRGSPSSLKLRTNSAIEPTTHLGPKVDSSSPPPWRSVAGSHRADRDDGRRGDGAAQSARRCAGCVVRTVVCVKNGRYWQKPRLGLLGRSDPGGLSVHESESGPVPDCHNGPSAQTRL